MHIQYGPGHNSCIGPQPKRWPIAHEANVSLKANKSAAHGQAQDSLANTRQNAYVCKRFEGILARNFSDALLIQNSSAPMRRVAEAAAHIHWNKK